MTATTADPNAVNNLANAATTVTGSANVSATKGNLPNVVAAGDVVSFELDVFNAGPSYAYNVLLQDVVPAIFEIQSIQLVNGGPGDSCGFFAGTNQVSCVFAAIPPLGFRAVFVNTRVRANAGAGPVANTVTATSLQTPDPCATNNTATVTTTITAAADLSVTKVALDPTPVAGGLLTYRVTVTNNGPSVATNVRITDTLPAGVTYVLDTLGCGAALANCSVGDLAPGTSRTFDIIVRVNEETACNALLTNTVTAASAITDTVAANNTATAVVRTSCQADLRVLKFGKPDGSVRAGQNLTYTIIVDNFGPSWAHGVVLTDLIASNLPFTVGSITSSRPLAGGACSPNPPTTVNGSQTFTCALAGDLETFAPGNGVGRWILTMVVSATQTSTINNHADVSSTDC